MSDQFHARDKADQGRRIGKAAVLVHLLSLTFVAASSPAGQIRWINPGSEPVGQTAAEPSGTPQAQARLQEKLAGLMAAPVDGQIGKVGHVVVELAGPITAGQRADLESQGIRLLGFLGDNAFFAALAPAGDARALSRNAALADVQAVRREWKLHPAFTTGPLPDWAQVPGPANRPQSDPSKPQPADDTSYVAAYVLFHPDVALNLDGRNVCGRHGGRVRSRIRSVNALIVELPLANVADLADEDAVQWIEPPLPRMSEINDGLRHITQTNLVHEAPYELDGTRISVLLYDGGTVWTGHDDLFARVAVRDASGESYHATHVAGTIGGTGAESDGQYRGIAPGVIIQSYGFEYDGSGYFLYTNPGDIEADYDEAINKYSAQVANNSIGTNLAANGFPCEYEGDYGVTSMLLDAIAAGSLGESMRIVWANGNERASGRCGKTYHTTAPPATAKNPITVGAVNSNDDSMTWFSSWGPTDDGRLKPDLCAPGCQVGDDGGVTSTATGGGYLTLCGTSMACPVVTGISALMLEQWRHSNPGSPRPWNSTFKAVLVHSAVDLGLPGPDYQSGYGSVRAPAAVDLIRDRQFLESRISQDEMQTFAVEVPPDTRSLKATLAWDDPPASPNVVAALVNDLDLTVISPLGGETFYPWTLDPANPDSPAVRSQPDRLNNLEQVVVDNPAAGTWVIRVQGHTVPTGPQAFSLVVSPLAAACSSAGAVAFAAPKVACGSVPVTVNDCDLDQDSTVIETVTVNVASDRQPAGLDVLLTEKGPGAAEFVGAVELATSPGPGQLEVSSGDTIYAYYDDADDGTGAAVRTMASAVVDCDPPQIAGVTLAELNARRAVVTFTTSEPAIAKVWLGPECGDLSQEVLEPGYRTDHAVVLEKLTPAAAYFFSVEVRDEAGLITIDDDHGGCFSFTTPDAPDYYTQQFMQAEEQPDHRSITFTPDGSIDFYSACVEPIAELPVDPTGGVWLRNGGQVDLPAGVTVSLYGVSYPRLYVHPSGYITFTAWGSDDTQTLENHFAMARISALWSWYSPPEAGRISYKALSDRYAITWEHVCDIRVQKPNTFQVELFFDGRLRMSWLELEAYRPIVGLSAGSGVRPDFAESDLKALPACVSDPLAIEPRGPLAARGLLGGPFEPLCRTYRLTNLSDPPADLTWSAQNTESWFSIAPAGGMLAAGEATDVQVCINAAAAGLPVRDAEYSGTVLFMRPGGPTQAREVQLAVSATMPPRAGDVLASTTVGQPVQVTLAAEDDGRPDPPAALTYHLVSPPAHGQVSDVDGSNTWTYTPDAGFAGVDRFTYQANDGGTAPGGGDSNEAQVIVRVVAPPQVPGPPDPPDGAVDVPVNTAGLSAGTAQPSLLRSAIVAAAWPTGTSDPHFTDPRDRLMATGRFHEVVIVHAGRTTPGLADLRAFDSVIVWSDSGFSDPVTLGDRLADYVDNRGGVVLAVFANTSVMSYGNVLGRFVTDDYFCIDYPVETHVGAMMDGPRCLLGEVFEPRHALMLGVQQFDGGERSFRPYSSYLAPQARLIANWNDGAPLVAVRQIGAATRVDLGMHPVSSAVDPGFWDASTNGDLIMANALALAGGASGAATVYDVYFGTDNPPASLVASDLAAPQCPMPGPLKYGTTYYWQVVARNRAGSAATAVYSFATPPAAVVAVRDSVPEPEDLYLPFGQVARGLTRTEQVQVCNADATGDLILTGMSLGRLPQYREDFDDGAAQDWQPTWTQDWKVEGGSYQGSTTRLGDYVQTGYTGQRWQDGWVHCTTRRTGGPYWAAVLAFRASDDFTWGNTTTGSAYLVGISGNRMFYVGRYVNGAFTFLRQWSYSTAFNWLTGTNEVTVNFLGSSITVYVNGVQLWSGTDAVIGGPGRIVLAGYAGEAAPELVYVFDDLEVGPAFSAEAYGVTTASAGGVNVVTGGTETTVPAETFSETWLANLPAAVEVTDETPSAPDWAAGFRLEGVPALPLTLAPGQCVTVQAVFAPQQEAAYRSGLLIEGGIAESDQLAVELTGLGGPGLLGVTPADKWTITGPVGGPFSPECTQYTVSNSGDVPLDWAVAPDVSWLYVWPNIGTLPAGGNTTVEVCLNAQAAGLPRGTYPAVIEFNDALADLIYARPAELLVCAVPPTPDAPAPADGALDVPCDTTLAWNVGLADPARCLSIGNAKISYASWNQALANVLAVAERQTLLEIRMRLSIASDMDLWFVVADSPASEGPFAPVWVRQVRVSPAGEAEYSSGSLHLTLEPGRFYAVGVAWGTDQIGFGLESRPLPVDWELGTLEGFLADSAWPPNIGVLRHVGTGSICPMSLCFVDGGAITYDVYLGRAGEAPVRICADAAEPTCPPPGPLDYRTLYLWKVIADNTCQQQAGAQWSFTTGGCGQNPPTLDGTPGYGAVLRRWHGQAGAFDVDLLAAASGGVAIECRASPAARMVLHFTRPIQALNGSPAADVRLIDGLGAEVPIANMAVAGDELTLDVGPLADGYYRLTLPGIADASDADCLVPDTLCFAVLAGDVDAGGKINAFDLTRVRARLLATAGASNFRFDVNADGIIDAYDLQAVRSYMGHVLIGGCP